MATTAFPLKPTDVGKIIDATITNTSTGTVRRVCGTVAAFVTSSTPQTDGSGMNRWTLFVTPQTGVSINPDVETISYTLTTGGTTGGIVNLGLGVSI